jgi:hypothetical protein
VPFLFGNFDVFQKKLVKNAQLRYSITGKFFLLPPVANILGKNFVRCSFQYPKVPLEWRQCPPPLQSFGASYAPEKLTFKRYAYTAISIKVVHKQNGKVEYDRYENSLIC